MNTRTRFLGQSTHLSFIHYTPSSAFCFVDGSAYIPKIANIFFFREGHFPTNYTQATTKNMLLPPVPIEEVDDTAQDMEDDEGE